MYEFSRSSYFRRKFAKLVKRNQSLNNEIRETLEILSLNPFDQRLKTHKVYAKIDGEGWSSRVNGDIRIIWEFVEDKIRIIELLDIGGHSGSNKVYK